jgi:KDO2-lipid IV(A) lauroyltransferase
MKEYLQYRAAEVVSRLTPRKLAYWISNRLACYFYHRDTAGRTAVIANLRRIHDYIGRSYTPEDLDRQARLTFGYFGKYLVDFFAFSAMSRTQIDRLVRLERKDCLERAWALQRGVLLVTAHFGSWEIGGAVIAGLGYPINAIVLPQKTPRLDVFFQNHRRRRGIQVIHMGNAVREIIDALRRRECVALLADRDYTAHSKPVPFFGAPARLPRGPAWLAHRTGVPLVPGFLLRNPDETYLVRFHPPVMPAENLSLEAIQRRLCAAMEEEIGRHPIQWYMFQDLWDGRPYET